MEINLEFEREKKSNTSYCVRKHLAGIHACPFSVACRLACDGSQRENAFKYHLTNNTAHEVHSPWQEIPLSAQILFVNQMLP